MSLSEKRRTATRAVPTLCKNILFCEMTLTTKFITKVGIIAALYTALTISFAPISYGPIQIRVSEALTVLPFISSAAIPGLFLGCFLANIYGPVGLYDIFLGSLCTLVAAFLTNLLAKTRKPIFAPIPPIFINAFGIGYILVFLAKPPDYSYSYWGTVLFIALGEIAACFILGYPLLRFILKNPKLVGWLK